KQSAAGPEPLPGQLAVAARRSEPASGTRKRRSIMARIAARAASGRTVPALAALAAASAFLAGAGMAAAGDYRHAGEEIGTVEAIYDGHLEPDLAVSTFRNIDRLFPTRTVRAAGEPHELPRSETDRKSTRLNSS